MLTNYSRSNGGGGTPRWNANSPDGLLLSSLIVSGGIEPDMSASQVQSKYIQFQKYNNNAFAQNLRRCRQLNSGAEESEGVNLPLTPIQRNTPVGVAPRTTPTTSYSPCGSSSFSAGARAVRFDVNEQFNSLSVDDDAASIASTSLPMYGSAALPSSKVAQIFTSAPMDMSHFFLAYPWIDSFNNHRITYYVLLSSIDVEYYSFSISACGLFLTIRVRIPTVILNPSQLSSKLHRKIDGTAAFGTEHIRHVSHRLAVTSLLEGLGASMEQDVYLPQSIRLPFQVDNEFCMLEGKGISYKLFHDGMKMAVVEMIGAKSARNYSEALRQQSQKKCVEDVSVSGYYTTMPQRRTTEGASVVSINPRGALVAQRAHKTNQHGVPCAISVQRMEEIYEDYGEDDDGSIPSARRTVTGKRYGATSSSKKRTVGSVSNKSKQQEGDLLMLLDDSDAAYDTTEPDNTPEKNALALLSSPEPPTPTSYN